MTTTTITTSFVLDARFLAYFVFTTLNAVVDATFEDPHLLLYSSVALRISVLTLIWFKESRSNSKKQLSPKLSEEGEEAESTNSIGIRLSTAERIFVALPLLATPMYFIGVKAPHNWESNIWSSMVDTVMALHVLTSDSPCSGYSTAVLHMYANFYTAAGFWKINAHFLDPTASCATVFLAQLLAYYGGMSQTTTAQVAHAIQPWFPAVTIVVELSMGLGLFLASCLSQATKWHKRTLLGGVSIVLFFHLGVCLMPRPHDISNFAIQCAGRLALVIPEPMAWQKVWQILKKHVALLCTLALLYLSFGIQRDFTRLNWDFGSFTLVMILVIWVLVEALSLSPAPSKRTAQSPSWWMWLAVALAFAYSFCFITLGLMEEASPNMFANLKIHGGSNHLIMPTGLLFHWAAAREAQGDTDSFLVRHWGGGEIRLESTTSEWLTEIYPNDMTHILEPVPVVEELLQQHLGASSPCAYANAGANRVLQLRERGYLPPPPHGQFIAYSVPALEWRRLLKEAFTYKGRPSFVVDYVHLPGSAGDETWRAFAWGRRVHLEVTNGEVTNCTVERNAEEDGKSSELPVPCGSNELPYKLDSVPWWLSKLSMYHGYPILHNPDGSARPSITCFGP